MIGKLKALTVARVKQRGMYGDGGGLYLHVSDSGARSWIFRYWVEERDQITGEPIRDEMGKVRGRSREMGLGSFVVVNLEQARELASEYRKLHRQGIDPIEARRTAKTQAALNAAKVTTFKQCAESYINAHRAGWHDAKHVQQWENTIAAYAEQIIGALPVQAIDTTLVCKVLEPIWTTRPETASRVRGRIERILDWAKARGYRDGENPARWRGHLDHLLPSQKKVARVRHHAAMPYDEVPAFLPELHKRSELTARMLEFCILTAARTGECIGATWDEIDLRTGLWIVPAERMKGGRMHRVPLCDRVVEILKSLPRNGERVFGLGDKSMFKLLTRMGRGDVTVHGFRSSFRDWAAERTNYANHVVEMALAHTIGDKVEAAYRRGDLFEKRRRLMDEWARFCNAPASAGDVIPLRRSSE